MNKPNRNPRRSTSKAAPTQAPLRPAPPQPADERPDAWANILKLENEIAGIIALLDLLEESYLKSIDQSSQIGAQIGMGLVALCTGQSLRLEGAFLSLKNEVRNLLHSRHE
ncbi:MAG: hypothetical protein ABSE62_15965 [Chthoniobacteraceae bacterium]